MPAVKASHYLRRISLGEPCEIMPAPRLPVVFAIFHWAGHAPRPPSFDFGATSCPCGIRNAAGRARHSERAGLCVRTFGGQRTARPTSSQRDNRKLARHEVSGSPSESKSVLKGRWNRRAFFTVAPRRDPLSRSPGTLSPDNF